MISTAALENIERYLGKISERSQKASDLLHSGLYGKNESSISELTERVLAYVEHELNIKKDRKI